VSILLGAIGVVAMFLLLIAPHEGGHFLLAKLFRVRVIEFSIGFGTKLVSWTRSGTLYALRLVPLGGYVRMGGMEPGDYSEPNGFHSKAAYQRLLILLAGPVTNFLMAALIMTAYWMLQLNDDPGKVHAVYAGTPAAEAGMQAGDSIKSVNGSPLRAADDIRRVENQSPGQPLVLVVRHPDGSVATVTIQPRYEPSRQIYLIGIEGTPVVTPLLAIQQGALFPILATAGIGIGVYQLAAGQIPGGFFGPEGVTGPVGISTITASAVQAGLPNYFVIVAALSVALGLANLLPLPALDGGRIVVVLLEKLRGKPFDREREMQVQRAGLVALLLLVVVITYFDIQRLISGQFPGLK